MRIAATVFLTLLFATPSVARADHEQRMPLPVQITIAGGANFHDDGRPETPDGIGQGALWLGGAIPLEPWAPGRSGLFVGPGVEGTVDGVYGPYQWSAGAGMRVGYAWRGFLRSSIPDAYVYTRITPFVGMRELADEEYLGDNPSLTRRGQGIRVGVGVTAPVWSAFVLDAFSEGGPGMHFHDPYEALACCFLGIAAVLINHGELTWEVYSEPGLPAITRVGFRIGTGF